jgi:hypothetical protein
MKRIEIIGNRSLEEDLFDIFKKYEIVSNYTKIPIVFGILSNASFRENPFELLDRAAKSP